MAGQAQKPPIIVLGRYWSTSLGVIRALGSAGYPVDLIGGTFRPGAMDIAAASSYVRRFVEITVDKTEGLDNPELLGAILAFIDLAESTPIIFPTDDFSTAIMDTHRDLFEGIALMPHIGANRPGELTECMGKTVQRELAEKAGLLCAWTQEIDLREEAELPADTPFPCFVKPALSINGYKTEMAVCNTPEELSEHLTGMRERLQERTVVIQEFLDAEAEYASSGTCAGDHVVFPAVVQKGLVGKHDRGVTLTGELYPLSNFGADTERRVISFIKSLDYTGNFGVDLIRANGKLYFNEINLRSTGNSFAYFLHGLNLPLLFVKHLLGEPIAPEEERLESLEGSFLYDKIAWEDHFFGHLTKEELDEVVASTDCSILRYAPDPEPARVFDERNEEKIAARERAERRRRIREHCIEDAMELTGWTREEAEANIAEARERLGVTYNDYRKLGLCMVPLEEQQAVYEEALRKRERRERNRRRRERCIEDAMERAGWTREEAEANIAETRERLGVTYNDYRRLGLCLLAPEEQEKAHRELLEQREKAQGQNAEASPEEEQAASDSPAGEPDATA